jgi:hypothetical protein
MSIHIKPSHKGLLHKNLGVSQSKKLTLAQEKKAANSKDPAVRKRANFAINARKWHHEEVEVIDEISKKVLKDYHGKAMDDYATSAKTNPEKANKRLKGMMDAGMRLGGVRISTLHNAKKAMKEETKLYSHKGRDGKSYKSAEKPVSQKEMIAASAKGRIEKEKKRRQEKAKQTKSLRKVFDVAPGRRKKIKEELINNILKLIKE